MTWQEDSSAKFPIAHYGWPVPWGKCKLDGCNEPIEPEFQVLWPRNFGGFCSEAHELKYVTTFGRLEGQPPPRVVERDEEMDVETWRRIAGEQSTRERAHLVEVAHVRGRASPWTAATAGA